ncbi:MAG: 30S ribosomal protein S7 [Chloroflexi bacterium]|nr:30S ribosomal protein S7 [Chloroflexota bacterium]
MPRRYRPARRVVSPDVRFESSELASFISKVMERGKRSTATRLVYDALDVIEDRTGRQPLEVFEQAMRNAGPVIEVKPRRVGGATYQVPVEVAPARRSSLAMRWLLDAARSRPGKTFSDKLAAELMDAAQNTGNAVKRREDTHRMAEANRAFAHYRW